MACHEIAALRLGMMKLIGIENEADKQHEINEIGIENLKEPGPLKSLSEAENMRGLKRNFSNTLVELEQKVSQLRSNSTELGYYRSLLVLTKKVEMELENSISSLERIYQDLDEIHDFVHEIYPAK